MSEWVGPVDKHVAERIRQRRGERRLTQKDLGALVQRAISQISAYERGTRALTTTMLWRLAQALRVDVGYFFKGYSDSEAQHDRPKKRQRSPR